MVSKRRKTGLNTFYGIEEVGGIEYREGFYDALDWFDKKIRRFLIDRSLLQEFANHLAKGKTKLNTNNSEKPIYLSACENKFKLNTKNSKEVKKSE